jgi:hypothetical protein
VSLARMGLFSEYHQFQIIKPVEPPSSQSWMILVVLLLLVATAGAVSYYYKHKIVVILRGQSDRIVLMKDIEPTDFNEMQSRHKRDFDELSDIMEYDE